MHTKSMHADRCSRCLAVRDRMGGRTPEGWYPFSWGPSTENPTHYYVTSNNDSEGEIDVTRLCALANPQRR
jgi:hypothetical protein